MIPAEIKEIIDRAAGKEHSATGSVMTALAEVLTVYGGTWTEVVEGVRALHRHERALGELQMRLIVAYERLIESTGLEQWIDDHEGATEELEEVQRLSGELDAATCQCCVFGNHMETCTCDGANCCHPENHDE